MPVPSCPTMHRARPTLLLPLLFVLGLLLHLADAQTPPKFLRIPNDQTGVQGGVASFICQATGDPRPKIVWNKKGKKVSNQRFEVIEFDDGSGSVLRIQPLRTPRDEAIYECVASNSVGETSTSTKLTVLREDQLPPGFPTIDMGPQLKVVERTRTATMLCAASGNPDPDIYWFKDFLPVNTTNNNGRIKQLRSGRFLLLKTERHNRDCVFLYLLCSTPTDVSSGLSSSSFSHNLTSHFAFNFVGNGIVSTISCPLLSVCPGVCCLSMCLPLSSSVVMGCWDCSPLCLLASALIAHCCDFLQ
uniref:Ig-like domain-containing protein n=1 Tax=Monopterus albus TaxID=43700 RepID=A0A3Q3IL99_MONAL